MRAILRSLVYRHLPRVASAIRKRRLLLLHDRESLRFEGPVYLGPGFRLALAPGAKLRVGPRVEFRESCLLEVGGNLTIGESTTFTYGVVIQCVDQIEIGRDCMIGTYVSIVDANHRFREFDRPLGWQHLETRPVAIGDEVLVNTKATITADVGSRAVVAAHAVVTKPVPSRTLAAGAPARMVSHLDQSPSQKASDQARARSRASE